MKNNFQERVRHKCMSIAKKHKIMALPCLIALTFILGIYYIIRHFATNGKRYIGIAFSLLFFMPSCSFSFGVFSGQTSFINTQDSYNAVVEDSDVTLAVEKEVTLDENALLEAEEIAKEYESTEDIENADFYTLDDILGDADVYEIENNHTEVVENAVKDESVPIFDSDDWKLILVNKHHPIPDDYQFNLGTIKGSMQCDERIIADLLSMLQAARDDGINLMIRSPYRTDDRQENNFNNRVKEYMGQGYSYMEAYKKASKVITIPGASEHQIGLALDITSDTHSSLDGAFGDTAAGKWLAEHGCEFGFVLRYPEGKEYITSIDYEPWHFRYVGRDAAMIMKQDDICLEEFWDKYL